MSLKYTCPGCGTPLGYEGLCWKCKSEQERKAALAWTPEQIKEKKRNLIQNIQRLADMKDPEFADFWQLLGYHDAITPEIQQAALAAKVFWPCEIYYHAPADVRDGLIHALLSTANSSEASNLMCCLAMQGDDKAMETLLELERNPRPWRKGLYVDPWTHPAMRRSAAGPSTRRARKSNSTSIPAILWSKELPARNLPSALAGRGRIPAPTVAGAWWICWYWMVGTSGSGSWGWMVS